MNDSGQSVTLKKGSRVCEVRNVIEVSPEDCENVRKVFDGFPDSFQYKSLAEPDNNSYLDDIQVDPDNSMTKKEKQTSTSPTTTTSPGCPGRTSSG